jgi:hypothetical protein
VRDEAVEHLQDQAFWEEIFASFDGVLPRCRGVECPVACCRSASVMLFPSERDYLTTLFPEGLPGRFEVTADGYFLLSQCSDGESCLYGDNKPVVCRTYPCLGMLDDRENTMTFEIDHFYCPCAPEVDSEFTQRARSVWIRIAQRFDHRMLP